MDPKFGEQLTDMRAMLEKTTAKVSVNDLKKKGFQKVKVIRASDINQMIYKAVRTVIAKGEPGMGAAEREKIIKESQAEFQRLMKQVQEAQKTEKAASEAQARAQAQLQEAESKALQIKRDRQQVEEARSKLEEKVEELNAQLRQKQDSLEVERREFAAQKQQLESQKQELYSKGLEAQKSVIENFEKQICDLESRLAEKSEAADALQGQLAEARNKTAAEEGRRSEREAEWASERQRLKQGAAKYQTELDAALAQLRDFKSKSEYAEQAEQELFHVRRRLQELQGREEEFFQERNEARNKAKEAEELKLELDRVRSQYTALKTQTEGFEAVSTKVQRQISQIDELEAELRKSKRQLHDQSLELDTAQKRGAAAKVLEREVVLLKNESQQRRSDLQRAEQKLREAQEGQNALTENVKSKLSEAENEVARLRMELMEVKSNAADGQGEMLGKIQAMFESHKTQQRAAASTDMNEKLDKMMRSISSIQSGTASASFVTESGDVDLSALFDNTKTQKIESNLDQVKLKTKKSGSMKGKLSKLKKLRGG